MPGPLTLLTTLEALIGRALAGVASSALRLARSAEHAAQSLSARLAALPTRTKALACGLPVLAALLFGAWELRDGPITAYEVANGKRPLLKARSWHYHLDKIDVAAMARNPADLIVMDFAQEGGKVPISRDKVEALKVRADGSRRAAVVSYISIGEAEDYRWYWQPAWSDPAKTDQKPEWLGDANCSWPDNYAVKFWHSGWKKLVFGGPDSFIGRIIKAGFDGVYLDRVDMYHHYKDERATSEADMVQFVSELAAAARAMKPGFIVIAQNGEDLLLHRPYRRVIDGLGKEDLLHGLGGTGVPNKPDDIAWSYSRLQLLLAEQKPVFAVEYLVTREAIAETRGTLRDKGLVPTFAHRNLDGSDPTMPRFEEKAAMGTPEYTKTQCEGKKSW